MLVGAASPGGPFTQLPFLHVIDPFSSLKVFPATVPPVPVFFREMKGTLFRGNESRRITQQVQPGLTASPRQLQASEPALGKQAGLSLEAGEAGAVPAGRGIPGVL